MLQNYIKLILVLSVCLVSLTFVHPDEIDDSLDMEHGTASLLLRRKRVSPLAIIVPIIVTALVGTGASVLKDQIFDDVKAAQPNQCKVSYAHIGAGHLQFSGGFTAEFITSDGDVNSNNEKLDGNGLGTDSTRETMSSAFYLDKIKFKPYRNPPFMPCIVAITVNCGNQVLSGGGHTSIGYQDMLNAWFRVGFPRGIYKKKENGATCVHFDETGRSNSFKGMTVYADALKCGNDRDCIQRNLKMW